MRSSVIALVFVGLTLGAVARADDGFTLAPTTPAARTFQLGKLSLAALQDAQIVIPNDGKSFGMDAKPGEVADVLRAAAAPTSAITLSVNVLLVKTEGHLVLLDAGTGPEWHGALLDSLKQAGIAPADVTDVLITHAHGDHINGLIDAQSRLAFPNATIRMSDEEWEWTKTKGAEHLVTGISERVDPFRAGAVVVPGIRSIALDGHTVGHVGYEISSGTARLRDIGDLAHSSIVSLEKPQWLNGFDRDADEARATRMNMLAELARTHELVFAPHFPYPGVGYIVPDGTAFKWQPSVP